MGAGEAERDGGCVVDDAGDRQPPLGLEPADRCLGTWPYAVLAKLGRWHIDAKNRQAPVDRGNVLTGAAKHELTCH
jgi:hypothetical protein